MAQAEARANIPGDGPAGEVTIADVVIAKLAGAAARRTYGVVDMHTSVISSLARFFRGSLTEGVEVDIHEGQASIGLHVVMERGINLAEVRTTLEEQVRYEVERVAGVRVTEVNVRVEGVRE
jgi:uncharacterized alkaline shock family protein YloU